MTMARSLGFGILLIVLSQRTAWTEDLVFSGPQPGEKLPGLKIKGVFGDRAETEFDPVQEAKGGPIALIFVHERTRPAFGLTNTVMRYAATRKKDGLTSGVVFLTDDATATENWMKQVQKYFSKGVDFGLSLDGQEGPGSYGLNRNVTLTVLIGNENRVKSNFALVQPSQEADGPKILKAIVDVLGGGEVPDIGLLAEARQRAMMRARNPSTSRTEDDPKLSPLLRAVINKSATPEDVAAAAEKVEEYVKEHEVARKQLGRVANTVVKSGKLSDYGIEAAQKYLKKWARKYGTSESKPSGKKEDNPSDAAPRSEAR